MYVPVLSLLLPNDCFVNFHTAYEELDLLKQQLLIQTDNSLKE